MVEAVYPATSDYVSSRSKVIPNGLEPLFSPWCWINQEAGIRLLTLIAPIIKINQCSMQCSNTKHIKSPGTLTMD
ncbi:hypothetical protein M378DRAFT_739845 [Amanita muscaria Koide BX008]|uniref:Uncharacterized protein n=1 Tax=Amanita muscaria (strain Koide BX008) TaxID=946122 RepID=A0A0C2WMU9_AMAMK|nr:hypothetical protein M378DRAFT_739845 [Amanita muscaria Koide BX008]